MQNEPVNLRKRFRHQEEYNNLYHRASWSKAILNVEGGTVLSRTPMRWLMLVVFYIIFYSGLFAFSTSMYSMFSETLTVKYPKLLLAQPGLSFEPSVVSNNMNIEYNEEVRDEVDVYIDSIVDMLEKYGNGTDLTYAPCHNVSDAYGYKSRNPCIFLKINRIIRFKTDPIENASELPIEAPNELRKHLKKLSPKSRKGRIWVSCESKPHIAMGYYPKRYFLTKDVDRTTAVYFENASEYYKKAHGKDNAHFFNENDYSRVIGVQLEDIKANIPYKVQCFIWAHNIVRDIFGTVNRGVVRFMFTVRERN